MRVHPLDEGGRSQPVATGGSALVSNLRNQQPWYGTLLDEVRVAGGVTGFHLAPDSARILRVFPCGANCVIAQHLRIRVCLKRVGAEVMGDELLTIIIEQGRLWREKHKLDADA